MAQRANITIDHTKVPANLTDFPVYVDLNTLPKELWADVRSTSLGHKLEAYWRFDEASGNAIDLVNSVPLVNTNVTYSSSNAKLNNGAVFNGSSSKLIAASNTSLDISTISWSCWVYRANTTSYFPIWNKTSGNGITFRINQTTNTLVIEKQGISTIATSSGTVGATTLTHVAATFDNTTGAYAFYINGVLSGSGTASTQSFSWGGDRSIGNDGSLWANGTLDELAVWSRVLTAAEVTELYNSGNGTQHLMDGGDIRTYASDGTTQYAREIVSCKRLQRGLVASWKLDESSGNAADSTGAVTLTNNNSVGFGAGLINNGADFGASNSSKNFTSAEKLGIGNGALTVSAWVKPSSYPSSDADPTPPGRFNVFGVSDSGPGISYFLHISNVSGTIECIFGRWRNSVAINAARVVFTPPTTSFTHLVGTYDGTTVKMYVNAGTPATAAASGNGSGGPNGTAIGSNHSSQAYFSGMIDEVHVWSRALSPQEITGLYNAGTGTALTDFGSIVTGEMHVKVAGTLSSTVDTTIQLHTTATDTEPAFDSTYGRNAVWSDYRLVTHGKTIDSSGNLTLTKNGNFAESLDNTKVGEQGYNIASASTSTSLTMGSISGRSFSCLARRTTSGLNGCIIDARTGLSNGYFYLNDPDTTMAFGGGWTNAYKNGVAATNNVTTYVTNTYYHFALRSSSTWTASPYIGQRYTSPVTADCHYGQFDEIRITKTLDTSADWSLAEYNNLMDVSTFYSSAIVLPGPANVKTVNGIASADIKTRNGITFSLVKSMNGL